MLGLFVGFLGAATAGCGDALSELEQLIHSKGDHGGGGGAAGSPGSGAGGSTGAQHCGGNIANPPQCPPGFQCVPDPANGNLPFGDVGGICQASPPPPACPPVLTCGANQQVCVCATGAFCLPGNAECIDPTSPCPTNTGALTCSGFQHICRCAGGAFCLAGNADCIAPTATCPPPTCN
jgi:hypothetical protein